MNIIVKPWENIDPSPLPDTDASLLAELYEYAEQIADADTRADSTSMEKAAKLEALYLSTAWSDEWSAAKPAKPDAVGRPPVPTSRNRFNEWMHWRAGKPGDLHNGTPTSTVWSMAAPAKSPWKKATA